MPGELQAARGTGALVSGYPPSWAQDLAFQVFQL